MSLIAPYNPTLAAEHNLTKLMSYGTSGRHGPEHITTEVGLAALKDHQKAQLGLWHQAKKYTASMVAYGAAIGVPVAAVTGGTYYLFKDYIEDPTRILRDLTDQGSDLGEGDAGFSVIGPNGLVSGPQVLFGLAALGATDYAMEKTTGYKPIRAVMSWTANMMSTALVYGAYKAGELTSQTYDRQERDAEATRNQTRKTIFEQTKSVFDNLADALSARAHEVRNSPKDIVDLKRDVERLQAKMSVLKKGLGNLTLQKSEIEHVLDKLNTTMRSITDIQFKLRKANSEQDHRYNTELMSVLTEAEFSGNEIPFEVRNLIDEIQTNSFSLGYKVQSIVHPIVSGAVAAVAVGAIGSVAATFIALACTEPPEGRTCWTMQLLADRCVTLELGLYPDAQLDLQACDLSGECSDIDHAFGWSVAAAAALSAAVRASIVSRSYAEQAAAAKAIVERNKNAVIAQLTAIYDGIARQLQNKPDSAELKVQAASIAKKLPLIEAKFAATGAIDDPKAVTNSLQIVVDTIQA